MRDKVYGNSDTRVPFRRYGGTSKKAHLPACLGRVIRQRREALHYSRHQISDLTGFYVSFIIGVEDATRDAYVFQLRAIAKALGTTLGTLLRSAGTTARLDLTTLQNLCAAVDANAR